MSIAHLKLLSDELAPDDAIEAGALGFMARVLVQATLPHSAQSGTQYVRRSGSLTVSIVDLSSVGLPYGSYPRLLLTWLTTEAVRTKSKEIVLGDSLSRFMYELGLIPTGGRWGSIPRLKDQMIRLFSAAISATYTREAPGEVISQGRHLLVAEAYDLWWTPQNPSQGSIWKSRVILSDAFYRQVTDRPVPIDLRAIRALKRSPLAIDIYVWATWRVSYMERPVFIRWESLQCSLGVGYAKTTKGRNRFRSKMLTALRKVLDVYPSLRLTATKQGILLKPSQTHISRQHRLAKTPEI
jgi:hypothetical protein